ncbi:MAG: helix-turn-helix domain-containing protein [Oscillospiraceae bacterium]|jgi:transcriptional regulator with XRE-family HTH domain|nr:helix-turn-helix domain-containing protein [Oscillospiraceae bacterium]
MKISIAESVKALRRARDLTQEELAARLGVTAQTVSKWETNAGYPDLETIPLIATFFDVTIDELFGMAAIRDEARIAEVKMRAHELSMAGPMHQREILDMTLELARDFPHNTEIQMSAAVGLLNWYTPGSDAKQREGLALLERLLSEEQDADMRDTLITQLLYAYQILGEREKLVELAQKLPEVNNSREVVMYNINLSKYNPWNEDALNTMRDYAQTCAQLLQAPISNMLNYAEVIGGISDEEQLELLDLRAELARLMFFEESQEEARTLFVSISTVQKVAFYATRDIEKALDALDKYVEQKLSLKPQGGQSAGWSTDGSFDENGDRVWKPMTTYTAEELVEVLFSSKNFDALRELPRFKTAVQRLKDHERNEQLTVDN